MTVVSGKESSDPLKNIVHLSARERHTCAVTSEGQIKCWGYGKSGLLGNGGDETVTYPVTVLADADGTTPLTGAVRVGSGQRSNCALMEQSYVKCWGEGHSGQLGRNTFKSEKVPAFVVAGQWNNSHLKDVVHLSVGGVHACALKANGTIECWGSGNYGRLGHGGDSANRTYPVTVVGGEGSSEPLVLPINSN